MIRNLILNYKFNEKPYLHKTFVEFCYKFQKEYLKKEYYDIIIPVPISRKRLKQRGYNQSYLIAKELAKMLNIELDNRILQKTKNNSAQSVLNKIEREHNVNNVYKLFNNKNIIGKRILLVDDIYTTGSTVNECSKILKMAKVERVDVLTLAKD